MSGLFALGAKTSGQSAKGPPVTDSLVPGSLVTVSPASDNSAALSTDNGTPFLAATGAVIAYCLLAGLLFFDTVASMVNIWLRSQTFAHGFLILPISLWLVWRMRARFRGLQARPEPLVLPLILGAGFAWLLAHLVDVQVIQQLAFVGLIITGIWAIVGTEIARRAIFPLGFLFLAVPMGAGLIPPLMEVTADTTELLLRISGIPVLREGMFLYLPTSTWWVIEECSGVRYLIAFSTLGLLYAYLTYVSLWRRAAFVAATLLVSVLANSARAYAVVMVGHLSDMRYGIGADHLIFGWLFFGLVMFLMFWIGGFWRQQALSPDQDSGPPTANPNKPALALILATGLAIVCAAAWPAFALTLDRNQSAASLAQLAPLAIPHATGMENWQTLDSSTGNWHWHPGQQGADRELDQVYTRSGAGSPVVGLHLRQYLQQHPDAQLVTSVDPWRPDRKIWRVISHGSALMDLDTPVKVDEVNVTSPEQNLLVWSWYRLDGRNTANPYMAKLLEAKHQILQGSRRGTRIFVATPLGDDRLAARAVLQQFVTTYHHAIATSLDSGFSAVPLREGDFNGTSINGKTGPEKAVIEATATKAPVTEGDPQ